MRDDEAPLALDSATLVLGRRSIKTAHGPFEVTFFRDQPRGRTTMAIAIGDLAQRSPLLARVHSSCLTSECLMASDCDCAAQLEQALSLIAKAGRGVVFYLMQEGRGAGLTAKARDRMIVQASGHRLTTFDAFAEMGLPSDLRKYDGVGPMARALGIRGPIELMTNNPEKAEGVTSALANEKIDVLRTRAIEGPTSPFNFDYLRAKRQSGHFLRRGGTLESALPPSAVAVEEPLPALGRPTLVSTANYLLPIEIPHESDAPKDRVDWFRMRVVYDRHSGYESVLLSFGDDDSTIRASGTGLTLALVDRLPCLSARGLETLRRRLIAIRDRGAGRIVVHFDDENPDADLDQPAGLDAHPDLTGEILSARWVSAQNFGGVDDAGR